MDSTSPLLLLHGMSGRANDGDEHQFPEKTNNAAVYLHDHEYDDDEADTLSLSDLPLHHSNNDSIHITHPAAVPASDEEDLFEFSREFLIKSDGGQAIMSSDISNSVVFCGKIIAHREAVEQQQQVSVEEEEEKKKKSTRDEESAAANRKKQSRSFRWKSLSFSSSSSSSASSSSSCCSSRNGSRKLEDGCSDSEVGMKKKQKKNSNKKNKGRGKGVLRLAIGVEWKYPVKAMEIKDIKVRQSRRMSANRSSFDYSNDASFRASPHDPSLPTKTSPKGLWNLLRLFAGTARPY